MKTITFYSFKGGAVSYTHLDVYKRQFQNRPHADGMRLVLDNGIFYEFVPFNDKNFNEDGELICNPETLMIDEVEEGVDYALLLSTCSGAWRYLIGDTVKFVNKERAEIAVTGRTKHYLSPVSYTHLDVYKRQSKSLIFSYSPPNTKEKWTKQLAAQ